MTNWSVSVLSSVTTDTEPTIIVTFDSAKYVFNVGENTTRAFTQSRRGRKRVRGIFLNSVGTQRGSGVSGLLMSLADSEIKTMDIVGPDGLQHWLASMRLFTYRTNMGVKPTEVSSTSLPNLLSSKEPNPVFKDANITVYAAPILPIPDGNIDIQSSALSGLVNADENSILTISGSKRKRTPSPPSSSKRQLHAAVALVQDDPSIIHSITHGPVNNLTLLDQIRLPHFSPTAFKGEEAQAWRRLTIEHMFSVTQTGSTAMNSRKAKGMYNPAGCTVQLPPFTYPHRLHSAAPALAPPDYFSNPTLAYIVVGPRVRGKFDVKKAEALGLKFGPLRGKLTRGEAVTVLVDDGVGNKVERVIRPEDCIAPSETPGVVLVLDTPTSAYIPALAKSFNSPFFSKFRSKQKPDREDYLVHTVFHICGDGVLEDPRYQEFMNGFDENVHHVAASRAYASDPVTFTSAAFSQLRINQLDANMFPLPKFCLQPKIDITQIPNLPTLTTALHSNTLVDVRPPRAPVSETHAESYDRFHPSLSSLAPLTLPPPTLSKFARAQTIVRMQSKEAAPGDDVVVIPLGTSSTRPCKYRNVSGTLIRIPNWGNILLDAGEGTWGQLARHFGALPSSGTDVWQILRDLRCIFISHMHGDHQIGLAKLLAMRKRLEPPPTQPLYLIANYTVQLCLREFSSVDDLGFDQPASGVQTILSEALHWERADLSKGDPMIVGSWTDMQASENAAAAMCESLGLQSFRTVDVAHRCPAYGAVIKHSDGWSIVFSGDTMPSTNLVRAGENATLLIHEATMADDQVEMARKKAHCTFAQAVDIGRRMNVKNLLLTHFSARYPKVPPSVIEPLPSPTDGPDRKPMTIALAFDHANMRIGDMWKMSHYLPAIEQSFLDTAEEGDEDQDTLDLNLDVD